MNSNGFIAARFDFTAFGEKISLGVGLRSIDQGYSAPANLRQGYGLTETDSATGLDHTWFRKNENRAGRWTSPDPYKGSMSLGNSGSFNRYSYVTNEPTNFVDPSGLVCWYVTRSYWYWDANYEIWDENGPTGQFGEYVLRIDTELHCFGGGGGGTPLPPIFVDPYPNGGGIGGIEPTSPPIEHPSPPKTPRDPCGQATDINVSYGNVNGSVIIGDQAIYVKGGVGVGVPGVGASMSLTNASPSEGLSLEGTLGAAIGGSRSVPANTPQQAMEFFNPSSESASASYGAMTPQASLSLNRTVRLFGLPNGRPECQK